MNLKQRYKSKSKKRLFRFIKVYLVFAFFLLFYNTFARYTTVVQNESTVGVADWQISINENEILNGTTLTNTIKLVPSTQTTTDNKLAPGQSGYFDLIINPEGTDVAIEYAITLNVNNLPKGIALTTYEIQEDNITANVENNEITGEINLEQMQQLTTSHTKTIRIYWEWEEDGTNIPTGNENYKIEAEITLKQKIS